MLCLTAFNPTFCSHGLSLPPSSLALFLLPARFPMSMAWAGRPLWAQHPCSSSFLRTVTFEIGVFFAPPHVLRKKTASLTLFTFPEVAEAVVEEAGSTHSPAHPLQHCITWCSGCAPCISSGIDPNTVIQDGPLDQQQDQHIPFKPATGYPVAGLHRSVPFLFRRRRAPSTPSVGSHSSKGFSVVTVVKSNKIVLTAHNALFPENPTN